MKFIIFGGNGFVGRHLAARLAGDGHQLVLPVRHRESAKELFLLPDTDVIAYDPATIGMLAPYLDGADAIINLVGILNEQREDRFVSAHNEFSRRVCEISIHAGVGRIIHVSALNAVTSANSEYLQSKAKAEQIIRNAGDLRCAIIRPSVIYGNGDSFVHLFTQMARWLPMLPLPCAQSLMQPIYINDVTAVISHVAINATEDTKTLSIGGPQTLTLSEIVRAALKAAGINRSVMDMGNSLSFMAAAAAEFTPGVHFYTRDNYLSAQTPSITPKGGNDAQRILGTLTALETGLSEMFSSNKRA